MAQVTNLIANGSTATASSYATASISPAANALVVVSVFNTVVSGTATLPTVTGASGTWVQIATKLDGTNGRRTTLFRDLSASPGSGALTFDFGGVSQAAIQWSVDQVTNADTTGTHGSGAVVQSASNTATGTLTGITVTLAALASSNNVAYGFVRTPSVAVVAGTGFAELSNTTIGTGHAEAEWATNQTAVAWTWASTSTTPVAIAIEVKLIAQVTNLTAGGQTAGTSATTASISPAANALVIVSVANSVSSGTANLPTVTGASGTWTQIATKLDATNVRRVTLFRDLSASPGSGTLAISVAGQTQTFVEWSVDQITNVDTTGTHGSGAVVQSASNTSSGTSTGITVTLAALGSSNNVAFGYIRMNTIAPVAGSGFVELNAVAISTGGAEAEWATNKTAVAWTWASTAGSVPVAMAIEIKRSWLSAATGVYALTGNTSALVYSHPHASATGVYALTGKTSALVYSHPHASATGIYVVTGAAAKLAFNRRLSAATGIYLLTGSASALVYSHPHPSATGVYALTGSASLLHLTRLHASATGAYALTGATAAFVLARKLAAATGVYALTGSTAKLAFNRKLVAATGVYVLTGSGSLLHLIRLHAGATGVYALSGSTATLAFHRKLVGATGVYIIAGRATLKKSHGWIKPPLVRVWTHLPIPPYPPLFPSGV